MDIQNLIGMPITHILGFENEVIPIWDFHFIANAILVILTFWFVYKALLTFLSIMGRGGK